MSRSREMAQLLVRCQAAGCRVARTRRGHYRIKAPNGGIVIVASTPTDHRAFANARSQLHRLGVVI